MNDNQINAEFEKIWHKIKEIESSIDDSKIKSEKNLITNKKKSYEGLAGGIRLLMDQGFLAIPRSVKQIHEELKREGYHYSYASTDKLIRIDLHKRTKTLNRIKEGKFWNYVIRK